MDSARYAVAYVDKIGSKTQKFELISA
jgi:hypothetical protein